MSQQSINFSAFDKASKKPVPQDYFLIGSILTVLILSGITFKLVFGSNLVLKTLDGVVFTILVVIFGIYAYRQYQANIKRNIALLSQFTIDNGFKFFYRPVYKSNGVIFAVGNSDHKTDYFISGNLDGLPFALYWHRFTTGSGRYREQHNYGVIEISLPKEVPQIFIEEKTNHFQGDDVLNIFKSHNLIQLEGDFNKHFNVYAAPNYQIEELTLLNPAFMAALGDRTDTFHVELVDKRAYIYMPNFLGIKKDSVSRILDDGGFLINELQKQMDTFRFTPSKKMPDNMQPSKFKKFFRFT